MESNNFEPEVTQEQAPMVRNTISRRRFLGLLGGGAAATILSASVNVNAAKKDVPDISAVAVSEMQAEMLTIADAIYSASGNTWMTVPSETVVEVTGGMDAQTSETVSRALSHLLSIAERDGGESAFAIKENLLALGGHLGIGFINVGSIVEPRSDISGYEGDGEVIYENSHFGGITIHANSESSLHITVPSKDGPVPQIKNGMNITTAAVMAMEFGRYGNDAAQIAEGYLGNI